jgi:hypothetical protein
MALPVIFPRTEAPLVFALPVGAAWLPTCLAAGRETLRVHRAAPYATPNRATSDRWSRISRGAAARCRWTCQRVTLALYHCRRTNLMSERLHRKHSEVPRSSHCPAFTWIHLGIYFAAVGLLRLTARKSPAVRGCWRDGAFALIDGPSNFDDLIAYVSQFVGVDALRKAVGRLSSRGMPFRKRTRKPKVPITLPFGAPVRRPSAKPCFSNRIWPQAQG